MRSVSRPRSILVLLSCFVALFLAAPHAADAQRTAAFPGATRVGQTSQTLAVTLNLTAGGTAAAPASVTQGMPGGEFTVGSGGTCTAGLTYSAGQQCTVAVTFTPQSPGVRAGAAVLRSTDGRVLGETLLTGSATGSLAMLSPGWINTVAGNGVWIYAGDGVPATQTSMFLPAGIAVDPAGNMFISDSGNNRIRRVDAKTGLISTYAGIGSPGSAGDHGPATAAQISNPAGLLLDGAGNLFIADSGNNAVRRVDAVSGIITTVAGTLTVQGPASNNIAATAATLSSPEGLAFDAAGNLYISDTGNHVVREVDAVSGLINTIAGTGVGAYNGDGMLAKQAQLNSPWGINFAIDGSLLIADLNNNRIRKVDGNGYISTVAGNGTRAFLDGGPATAAALNAPASVLTDPAGDLFIADSGNNRVREVGVDGNIRTIVGIDNLSYLNDNGPANLGSLYGPYALFYDGSGNLFIADMFRHRIREVASSPYSFFYADMKVGGTSAPQTGTVENHGNADLVLGTPQLTNAKLAPGSTCAAGTPIPLAQSCTVAVEFAPTTVGAWVLGSVVLPSNAANSPSTFNLSGKVLAVEPSITTLVSNANPSLINSAISFTATVTSDDPGRTGLVVFYDGTVPICSLSLNGGQAVCIVGSLPLGQHNITATYSGDANNNSSTSAVLVETVKQAPVLSLGTTPNPAIVTSSVTLTLTATTQANTPSGTVSFYDGALLLGTANMNGSGVAVFTASQLAPGTHTLSAQYAGDLSNMAGQSNNVKQVVQQASTTTSMTTSNSSAVVGTPVTLHALVTSNNGPAPTGTVQLTDGSTNVASQVVATDGTVVFGLSSLAAGQHQFVATYSGDTDDATSVSVPVTVTIGQISTTTMLAADKDPANAGATVRFTASVVANTSQAGAGALDGNVVFTDGSTTLGTVALDTGGHAVLDISTLAVGSHTVLAQYKGDTNYAASASSAFTESVQQNATAVTATSAASTTFSGKPVNVAVTVSGTAGTPTGTVALMESGTQMLSAPLDANGAASFATNTLSVGTHTLTVAYLGDSKNAGSSSAPWQQIVVLAPTTLVLSGPGTAHAGTAVTFSVALTSNGMMPTGTVTLLEGTTVVTSQALVNAGAFSFRTSSLSVGSHTLYATYAGDNNNAPSTSSTINVVVAQAPTTTTLTSSANPSVAGQSLLFTATVASDGVNLSGTVAFYDGTALLSTTPVSGAGLATYTTSTLAPGMHTITAQYAGDTTHTASASSTLSENIVQTTTATLVSSLNPSVSGNGVTFSTKITGAGSALPSGVAVFKDGATVLASTPLDATGSAAFSTAQLAVGSHTITVTYGGDANYAGATATVLQTVQNASTQINLTASANPATYGQALLLTASVVSNGSPATGTVSFVEGGNTLGTATLNAGTAVLTLNSLTPGAHTFVANYGGDGKAGTSSSTPLTVAVKQITQLALASSVNPAQTLTAVTLTATLTNPSGIAGTGSISFNDGASVLGTAALDGSGHATLTVPAFTSGQHALQATYAGDGQDFGSSATLTQTTTLRPTTVTLSASSTDPTNAQQVTIIAVVHWSGSTPPTGSVSFKTGGAVISSPTVDATGVATLTLILPTAGESIVASYNGDAAYAASDSAATDVKGGPATQFSVAVNPINVTLQSRQHTTINVTFASIKGYSDNLELGCLGLPTDATCTFNKPQVQLDANGSVTVQLTLDTGNPLGAGASASNSTHPAGLEHGALLCFLPVGLLFGIAFRRKARGLSIAVLLLCLGAPLVGLTGCSGLQVNGTPAGSYVLQISAAGQRTGVTQTTPLNLTVTQ